MSSAFQSRSPALMPDEKSNAFHFGLGHSPNPSTESHRPMIGKPQPYDGPFDTRSNSHSSREAMPQDALPRKHLGFWHYWWLESFCCILVLSAFGAIIAVLWTSDGKALPQLPLSITINTLVAVLAAILKSALIFIVAEGLSHLKWAWFRKQRPLKDITDYDMASRGPLGSLRLLLTLRGRDFVATVGALLTIAALAIDPFAQAVVQHYSCSTIDTSVQATIPRTSMYSETGAHIGAGLSTVPPGISAAANAGIYANSTGAVPFNCPSGTCNFDQTYSTLGFCHSCSDITSQLVVNSTKLNTNGNYISNYSLPSGVHSTSEETDSNYFETYFTMGPSGDTGDVTEMILSFPPRSSLAGAPSDAACTQSKNQTFGCNNAGAASCSLFPCVKTYQAAVSSGNLTEKLVSTFSQFGSGEGSLNVVDVDCLSPEDRQNVSSAGITIAPGQKWLPYNISLDMLGAGWLPDPNGLSPTATSNDSSVKGMVSAQCIYEMNSISAMSIQYWGGTFFNGSVVEVSEAPNDNGLPFYLYSSLQADASLATLDAVWANIAGSLTGYIRQHGDATASANATRPALGAVVDSQTCVAVRWAYLAFPGAMVALTVLFFVAMVCQTRREQRHGHDWKSSPLALLYHGLDRDTLARQLHAEIDHVGAMTNHARELRVQLAMTEQGWKLVSVE